MRFYERKPMELVGNHVGNHYEAWGHISFEHLAIPETVQVMVMGEPFIPESFNIYGAPNFTEEAAMLYKWKEDEIRRQPGKENFILEAEISYEERIFDVPRKEFDSIQGILESTYDLKTFNQMLDNRRLFTKASDERLNEFVVLGKYWLDQLGRVGIRTMPTNVNIGKARVLYKKDVDALVKGGGYSYEAYIPNEKNVCPCCGRKFTIEDLTGGLGIVNGKISHDACRIEFEHRREIDKLSRRVMGFVYDKVPFDLLPNGYCSMECCKHIPWLKFHTPDGDIIIGTMERDIFIEWQENFKPFDMAIFNKENVTKWIGDDNIYKRVKKGNVSANVKRGIHAGGENKAYEYLNKVKELVNSEETVK